MTTAVSKLRRCWRSKEEEREEDFGLDSSHRNRPRHSLKLPHFHEVLENPITSDNTINSFIFSESAKTTPADENEKDTEVEEDEPSHPAPSEIMKRVSDDARRRFPSVLWRSSTAPSRGTTDPLDRSHASPSSSLRRPRRVQSDPHLCRNLLLVAPSSDESHYSQPPLTTKEQPPKETASSSQATATEEVAPITTTANHSMEDTTSTSSSGMDLGIQSFPTSSPVQDHVQVSTTSYKMDPSPLAVPAPSPLVCRCSSSVEVWSRTYYCGATTAAAAVASSTTCLRCTSGTLARSTMY